jgi:hypothetical protein
MSGQVRSMIDQIIDQRSRGNAVLATTTRTKLILKGLDPAAHDASSPDDPMLVARLRDLAAELSVTLEEAPLVGITVAHLAADAVDVGFELKAKLGSPAVVVYFASPKHDPGELASAIARSFPSATTFGCTSAGEIVSGAMTKGAIVAMGLGSDVISRAEVAVARGVMESVEGIDRAFREWEGRIGQKMLDLDPERWIGVVLVDGLTGAEERVMDRIGNLTNVIFIGGSAGDDLAFKQTLVAASGHAESDAAVVALFECPAGFDVIKTQSFHASRHFLVPTRVDKAAREVIEFNGKPAVAAYAEALGVKPEDLSGQFMAHPLGLMIGGEPFVRSPQQIVGDSVRFFCGVDEGMKLAVLESTGIVEDTAAALDSALKRNPGARGLLNFNCILRTLELEDKGLTGAYGKVFTVVPTIGFSTYGEEYMGHINQTATMVLFR